MPENKTLTMADLQKIIDDVRTNYFAKASITYNDIAGPYNDVIGILIQKINQLTAEVGRLRDPPKTAGAPPPNRAARRAEAKRAAKQAK